jgi:hypothetical protein
MGRINHAGSIHPAVVYSPVANSAHACSMEPAVRSTVGAQRAAKIASEVVIVQRASAAAGNVLALLQVESVTLMSAATAGLAVEMVHLEGQLCEGTAMIAVT